MCHVLQGTFQCIVRVILQLLKETVGETYDLSDFEREQIVVALLAAASAAELFNVSRVKVSTTTTQNTSAKRNTERNIKLIDIDQRILKRIVTRQSKDTAAKVTAVRNAHMSNTVLT